MSKSKREMNNSEKYDIFVHSSNNNIKSNGVVVNTSPEAQCYKLNSAYIPFFQTTKNCEDLTKAVVKNFIFKTGDKFVDKNVFDFLNKNAGLTVNENSDEINDYKVVVEGNSVSILNGQSLTNVSIVNGGNIVGYTMPTKYGWQDPANLAFINDIGQDGKTTDLVKAFKAEVNGNTSNFSTATIKATDYPPIPEVVLDSYNGTCVFFTDKVSTDYSSEGVVNEDSATDYLMVPYIQSIEGKVTPTIPEQNINNYFNSITNLINGEKLFQANLDNSAEPIQ